MKDRGNRNFIFFRAPIGITTIIDNLYAKKYLLLYSPSGVKARCQSALLKLNTFCGENTFKHTGLRPG